MSSSSLGYWRLGTGIIVHISIYDRQSPYTLAPSEDEVLLEMDKEIFLMTETPLFVSV